MTTLVLNRKNVGVTKMLETTLTVNENTIEIYDNILPWKYYEDEPGVTVKDVTNVLNDLSGDITVRINSRGGEVGTALTIFNRLKEYSKGKTKAVVDGYAFSSAGWVALACNEVSIAVGGIFMCHNPLMFPAINSLEDLESAAQQWKAHHESIVNIFVDNTKVERDDIINMMKKETFLSAQEVVDKGIYHSVHGKEADLAVLNFAPPANIPETFNIRKPNESEDISHLRNRRMSLSRKTLG